MAEHFTGMQWNDFSNMNGGHFAPHAEHTTGNSVDGYFDGYEKRDAKVAQTLIDCLNDATYGSRIEKVFVAFTPAFEAAIKDVTLKNGQKAAGFFHDNSDHDGHFHFDISD